LFVWWRSFARAATEPNVLEWPFAQMSLDTTKPNHAHRKLEQVIKLFEDENQLLIRIQVPLPDKLFIICISPAQALYKIHTVIGCGTRGFVAVCVEKKLVGWVKDTWRLDLKMISPEGETYGALLQPQTIDFPLIVACGDLDSQKTMCHSFSRSYL
jgi:hypothetical protein